MTTETARRDILDAIGNARDVIAQAHMEGAALRGELGPEAQILALSEVYKRLRAAGKVEEAAAVKAQAYAIHEAMQQQQEETMETPNDTPLPISDLPVPDRAAILAIVKERFDQAQLHGDYAGAGQLNRVRQNLLRGARLAWHLGDLLIQSINNRGAVYSVNARGCTCPNGAKGKAECWHVALYDILIDLQEEEAATADMEADRAAEREERAAEALGRRLCAARSRLLCEAA